MKPQDIGLIGLAVMGQNLVLNMERNGFGVAVYNRTAPTTTAFIEGAAAGIEHQGGLYYRGSLRFTKETPDHHDHGQGRGARR